MRLHQHLTQWLRAQAQEQAQEQAQKPANEGLSRPQPAAADPDDAWHYAQAYPPAPDYPERQGTRFKWHMVLEAPTRMQRALLAEAAEGFVLAHPGVEVQIEIDPLSQS